MRHITAQPTGTRLERAEWALGLLVIGFGFFCLVALAAISAAIGSYLAVYALGSLMAPYAVARRAGARERAELWGRIDELTMIVDKQHEMIESMTYSRQLQ